MSALVDAARRDPIRPTLGLLGAARCEPKCAIAK